ncbi:hypothetical protein LX36DRAFT_658427 [Colletotrichum falcatum]|nr:hypothetical protein LX36DRAFT_658427 [Colletotrichum falcatum]
MAVTSNPAGASGSQSGGRHDRTGSRSLPSRLRGVGAGFDLVRHPRPVTLHVDSASAHATSPVPGPEGGQSSKTHESRSSLKRNKVGEHRRLVPSMHACTLRRRRHDKSPVAAVLGNPTTRASRTRLFVHGSHLCHAVRGPVCRCAAECGMRNTGRQKMDDWERSFKGNFPNGHLITS